ncbi:MAG: ACP S-malonyltransferase [Alphaproteobacteria bacterium]
MTIAFVYPGQGSQIIGMAKDLYDNFAVAKNVLDAVCDVLKQDLKTIMFEGPTDELTFTENTQPALLAASMMAQKVLETELGKPIQNLASAVAGHSLGEYSALTAAGAFSVENAAVLVRLRGNAMQKAVPVGQGAMAAILGLEMAQVEELLRNVPNLGLEMAQVEELLRNVPNKNWVAQIANDNSPGQIVVSGHTEAIAWIIEQAKEKGAKRALLLPVSAPFHSSLMEPAALVMEKALSTVNTSQPKVNVYANVTAMTVDHPAEIAPLLVAQITGRVRWTESISNMHKRGINTFVEIGTGKVLSGLIKRIAPEANVYNFGNKDELQSVTALWM